MIWEYLISAMSLGVAALTIVMSSRNNRRAMIGPMREKWMGEFRLLLSKISSKCLHYWQSGFEDLSDEKYLELTQLRHQVIFMTLPDRQEQKELAEHVKKMIEALGKGKSGDEEFFKSYQQVIELGRKVLVNEWQVVKKL